MLISYIKRKASGHVYRCQDSPDMTAMNTAAAANAEIGKEALAFYKQAYADQAPLRDAAQRTALDVSQSQMKALDTNTAISNDYWDYQKSTFRPLEQSIVADAQAYDTPARREAEAVAAGADVQKAGAAQMAATQRQQASMGVDPNSGRAQALQSQQSLGLAAATAGAMNTARKNVETVGYARKMDAGNLGRNLASSQATSASVALNAGNAATGNANAAVQTAQNGTALVGQGMSTAIGANNSAGSLYGQVAQMEAQSGANNMSGLGSLVGAGARLGAAYITSDENVKSGVKPASAERALAEVNATPVKEWRYDPAKGGPDDGGLRHTGPMAQDVNRNMGDRAAPGGTEVDLISLNGKTMLGLQAVDRKVNKLTGQVKRLAGLMDATPARRAAA